MECKVEVNEQLKKEYSKDFVVLSIVFSVLAVLGVVVLLLPSSEYVSLDFLDSILKFLIVFCVIVVLLCVIQIIGINKQFKRLQGRVNDYEFLSESFTVTDFKINSQTGEKEIIERLQIKYYEITRFKETERYLFIFCGTLSYPVLRSSLSNEEYEILKEYIKKGIKKYG